MAVFSVLGAALTAGSFATAIGQVALAVGLSLGSQLLRQALAPDPEKPQTGIQGKIQTDGDSVGRSFLLGTSFTSGSLVYAGTFGTDGDQDNLYLAQVIQLSDLPIRSLDRIYVSEDWHDIQWNDTSWPFGAPVKDMGNIRDDGTVATQCMWVRFYDGTQTTADPKMVNWFGAPGPRRWTNKHIGKGCAYVVVISRWKSSVFSSFPQLGFECQGLKLYNPANDGSVGGSGSQRFDNQSTWGGVTGDTLSAVQIYNIMRGLKWNGSHFYGMQKMTARRLPAEHWIAQIQKCAELVPVSNSNDKDDAADTGAETEPRYRSGAEVLLENPVADTIKDLMSACTGRMAEMGGLYKLHVGKPGDPVFSITDEDILVTSEQSFTPFFGLADTVNGIVARFPNRREGWAMKDSNPLTTPAYEAEDGGRRLLKDVQLPMVPYRGQVFRLKREALKVHRNTRQHSFTLGPRAQVLEPADVISWSSDRNGYAAKRFSVDRRRRLPNGNVMVDVTECNFSDYDPPARNEYPKLVDGPLVPKLPPKKVVTNLVASPATVTQGGKKRPAIRLTYAAGNLVEDMDGLLWELRIPGQNDRIADGYTKDLDGDVKIHPQVLVSEQAYEVRAKFDPSTGRREALWSDWIAVTTPKARLSDDDLDDDTRPLTPNAPTITSSFDQKARGALRTLVSVSWIDKPNDRFVDYEVFWRLNAGQWESKRTASSDRRVRFRCKPGDTVEAYILSRNRLCNASAPSATATHVAASKSSNASAPSGWDVVGTFRGFRITGNKPTADDHDFFEVFYQDAATPAPVGATPATVTEIRKPRVDLTGFNTNDLRFFWVRAVDTSGNPTNWFYFGSARADKKVADDDIDDVTAPLQPDPPTISSTFQQKGRRALRSLVTVSWVDKPGDKFSDYEVFWRINGGAWESKRTKSDERTLRFRCAPADAVQARIMARSRLGNESVKSTITSHTAAAKSANTTLPTGWAAVGVLKGFRLKGDRVTVEDHDFFEVYYQAASTPAPTAATVATETEIRKPRLDLSGFDTGDVRSFWVRTVDTSGFASTWVSLGSATVATKIKDNDVDDVEKPLQPNAPVITSGFQQKGRGALRTLVQISWTDKANDKFSDYELSYRVNAGSWRSTRTKSADRTFFFRCQPGDVVQAQLISRNRLGNESPPSATTTHTAAAKSSNTDTPSGWNAVGTLKGFRLKGDKPAADDFDYFELFYQAASSPAPTLATVATETFIRKPRVDLTGFETGDVRSFWIRSVDTSGYISAWVSLGAATAGTKIKDVDLDDTALATPAAPTITSVFAQKAKGGLRSQVTIAFAASAGAADYEVEWRIGASGEWTSQRTKSADLKVKFRASPGDQVQARVWARNKVQTESSKSATATHTVVGKGGVPAAPSGSVEAAFKGAKVTLAKSTDDDFDSFELLDQATQTPAPTAASTPTVFGVTTTRVDLTALANGQARHFWARRRDTSDGVSAWTYLGQSTATGVQNSDLTGVIDDTSAASGFTFPGIVANAAALPAIGARTPKFIWAIAENRIYQQNAAGTGWTATNDATLILGQLVAAQIAVGTLTADRFAVGAQFGANLVANPSADSGSTNGWGRVEGNNRVLTTTGPAGRGGSASFRITGSAGATAYGCRAFPVQAGKVYSVRAALQASSGVANGVFVRMSYLNSRPTNESLLIGSGVTGVDARSGSDDLDGWNGSKALAGDVWTDVSTTWTAPTGAQWASLSFYRWTNMGAVELFFDAIEVREQLTGVSIADNTITAAKANINDLIVSGLALFNGAAWIKSAFVESLSGDKVELNTLRVGKQIILEDFANLIPDNYFRSVAPSGAMWAAGGSNVPVAASLPLQADGGRALAFGGAVAAPAGDTLLGYVNATPFPVKAGKKYKWSWSARYDNAAGTGTARMMVYWYDVNGAGVGANTIGIWSAATEGVSVLPSADAGGSDTVTAPAGAVSAVVQFRRDAAANGGTDSGLVYVFDAIFKRPGDETIINRGVLTRMIEDNAISDYAQATTGANALAQTTWVDRSAAGVVYPGGTARVQVSGMISLSALASGTVTGQCSVEIRASAPGVATAVVKSWTLPVFDKAAAWGFSFLHNPGPAATLTYTISLRRDTTPSFTVVESNIVVGNVKK
ncbi:phage tail protein [Chenggangzhangella methanolivorans]|uniref:Tip attachment protein J domain-containing protein n=1 Tax=Chenggangzhangella methanolivorans TaxID=1437009 RepID=A0A9E6UPA9_9HYPH|nr:phage tail protein [Chenggangzhangella methanolivorans]QZN99554.1 hypothetical protein K6K41_23060 [Chenggangzhangella methanolivorans]